MTQQSVPSVPSRSSFVTSAARNCNSFLVVSRSRLHDSDRLPTHRASVSFSTCNINEISSRERTLSDVYIYPLIFRIKDIHYAMRARVQISSVTTDAASARGVTVSEWLRRCVPRVRVVNSVTHACVAPGGLEDALLFPRRRLLF